MADRIMPLPRRLAEAHSNERIAGSATLREYHMEDRKITSTKRIVFWAVLVLILVGFVEIVSAILLYRLIPSRVRNRAAFRTAQDYATAYRQSLARFTASARVAGETGDNPAQARPRMFHSVLGWDYPPHAAYTDAQGVRYEHGPRGERRTCTTFPLDLIATYGDSFTYCSDEPDCSTWQTYLGELLAANVLNFGVAGYGTDQAYLKYALDEARVSTPVVMLGILPDDINRSVNVFRTFYAPDAVLALPKPRYLREQGGFRLLPNPVQKVEDMGKLEDPQFLQELGRYDYWFEKWRAAPRLGFPYSLSLVLWRKTVVEYLWHDLNLPAWGLKERVYPENLFEEAEPLAVMCHIVDLFMQTAKGRGARAVVVLMAHRELILEAMQHGQNRVHSLVRHLEDKGYPYVDLIQALSDMKPTREDLNRWFREHATPEGNEVIARIIAERLRRDGVLEGISIDSSGAR